MGLDKETIEKRVSRIELDIDHMNKMIDENLKLNEAGEQVDEGAIGEATGTEKAEAAEIGPQAEKAEQELSPEDVVRNTEENMVQQKGSIEKALGDSAAENNFKEVVGSAADTFVGNASKQDEIQTAHNTDDTALPRDSFAKGSAKVSPAKEESLERSEGKEISHDSRDSAYGGQEVQQTRSEASNDDYYDWSEDQQDGAALEANSIGQNDADKTFQAGDTTLKHIQADQESEVQLHQHQLPQSQMSSDDRESNDEWEDDPEQTEEAESAITRGPVLDNNTPNATPHIPQHSTLQRLEQDTARKTTTKDGAQTQYGASEQRLGSTNGMPYDQNQERPQVSKTGEDIVESESESESERVEFAYKAEAHVDFRNELQFTESSNAVLTGPFESNNPTSIVEARQDAIPQSSDGPNERFKDDYYDVYDEPHTEEEPEARSSVSPGVVPAQQGDPYAYPYETFEAMEPIPPRTADTSQDSHNTLASDKSYDRSLPSTAGTEDSIYIPKNGAKDQRPATTNNTPVTSRRPTNPFRVVSVGVVGPDGRTSRKTSAGTYSHYKDHHQVDGPAMLQRKLDHLTKKCAKLQKEISYLTQMNSSSSLPIEDSRKLSRAIAKLQEYFDKKNKEKYEVGVLLSRQLRKEIDRGENGQFWIGTK